MSVRTIAVNQCWVDILSKWRSKNNLEILEQFSNKMRKYKFNISMCSSTLCVCLCVLFYLFFATRHDIYSLSPRASPCRELTLTAKMKKESAQLLERALSYEAMSYVSGDAAFQVVSFIVRILRICFMHSPMLNTA